MKALTASILTLALLLVSTPVIGEEMAKEGTSSGKAYYTGTYKMLPMEKERLQMNYEGFGVSVSDTGKGLLHNASARVVGALHAIKGVFEESGFIVFTRPDGDKVFMTYKGTGQLGKSVKGTLTYVGGTGKCKGIQGSGEFKRYSLRPPTKGMFASFSTSKSNWKLPSTKK